MSEGSEVTRKLKALREKTGLSQRDVAQLTGMSSSGYSFYESNFKKSHLPMELVEKLRPVFEKHGVSVRELLPGADQSPDRAVDASGDVRMEFVEELSVARRNFPIYATRRVEGSAISIGEEPVEYIKAPAPLSAVRDGYGFYMVGDEMAPRFSHGDTVLVHPSRPPKAGDPVVVYLKDRVALVRLLVSNDGEDKVRLAQYGTTEEAELDSAAVQQIHLIVGSYLAR